MTPAPADMADTAAKPVLSKRQRTEKARQIKAEKRALAVKAKLEGVTPKAMHEARKARIENPAKRSRAWRYMVAGQIDGAEYSAAVEYADLVMRVRDTKVGSYGDNRGGSDGGGVPEAQLTAVRKLRAADAALGKLELPAQAVVYAVCVDDWSASDFLREYGLDANKGLPLLRLGLRELARLWRMPARRARSGVESF